MKQQGILSAKKLIEWKKSIAALKVPVAPRHVIICPRHAVPPPYQTLMSKEIKGLMGKHVCVNKKGGVYLSTGWGVGGAALVAICEELHALGARSFTLVGLVGRLSKDINEGTVFYADSALREEGTSAHYLTDAAGKIITSDTDIAERLGLQPTRFVSTDAPYRETANALSEWTNAGCTLVDMETASLYAFAKYYDINALSIGIAADSIAYGEWQRPQDMKKLNTKLKNTVNQLVDFFS